MGRGRGVSHGGGRGETQGKGGMKETSRKEQERAEAAGAAETDAGAAEDTGTMEKGQRQESRAEKGPDCRWVKRWRGTQRE